MSLFRLRDTLAVCILAAVTTHKRNTKITILADFTHAGLRCELIEAATEVAPIPSWTTCNGVAFGAVDPNVIVTWYARIDGVVACRPSRRRRAARPYFFNGETVATACAMIERLAEEQRERRDSRERAERDSAAAVEAERNRTPEEREAHLDELRRNAIARFDARRRA